MDTLELLRILEERLEEHDNSRKEVQNKLQKIHSGILTGAASLEEKVNEATHETFNTAEERILGIINQLNAATGEGNLNELIQQAQKELSTRQRYEVKQADFAENFSELYTLSIVKEPVNGSRADFNGESDATKKAKLAASKLQEHLESIHESMVAAQDRVAELCTRMREEAEKLNSRINEKLEWHFKQEDARLQESVKLLREKIDREKTIDAENLDERLASALFIIQKYSLDDPSNAIYPPNGYELRVPKEASLASVNSEWNGPTTLSTLFMDKGKLSVTIVKYSLNSYELRVSKEASLTCINFEKREPTAFSASFTDKGELSVTFTFFSDVELSALKLIDLTLDMDLSIWEKGANEEDAAKTLTKTFSIGTNKLNFISHIIAQNTTYCVKARIKHNGSCTQWSSEAMFVTPEFKTSVWKECPKRAYPEVKYFLDENNPRIATRESNLYSHSIIIGNTNLPFNKVTSWNVKILHSDDNDASGIFIGVAPSDIDQNCYDFLNNKNGWYLNCYSSELWSGPPHNYGHFDKEYGPRRANGQYVHTGDSVGVIMDTKKGELSFALGRINYGVAYKGIPLNKPLVPCVLIEHNKGNSVELDTSGVKEAETDSSIPAPSNTSTKSDTWELTTFAWDEVGGALLYQIEIEANGKKSLGVSAESTFTKSIFLPDTEYSFRVRAVRRGFTSEWSKAVKGRTPKETFKSNRWKKCPGSVDERRKYFIDMINPKVASNIGRDCFSTILWNECIPPNGEISWSIKIVNSKMNNGGGIFVGVAPPDIDQSRDNNFSNCGWYFDCYSSSLYSGPPHNYKDKEYGPRKREGHYVRTRDSVGVVMDTKKGDLSFVLDGVSYGIAFEWIPLDEPLVPCVLVGHKGDSIEFVPTVSKYKVVYTSSDSSSSWCIIS